ncbi:MAG: isochorismatase family protein [Actinomycetota bacterium]
MHAVASPSFGDTSVLAPRSGYRKLGAGERAALLIVDMQNAFIDEAGALARDALAGSAALLSAFRQADRPVFFGALRAPSMAEMNLRWRELGDVERLVKGTPSAEIHSDLSPRASELVVEKVHASCFYGTSLEAALEAERIDTLVVAGTATSGCIRATVVDAAARSLRVLVAEDAVFDWRVLSGEVALNDIAERYGDVVSVGDVLAVLQGVSGA